MMCDVILFKKTGPRTAEAFRAKRRRKFFFALCVFIALTAILVYAATASRYVSSPGEKLFTYGSVTIDYSNASEGYVAVKHKPIGKKVKLRVQYGGHLDTYDLADNDEYVYFPLQYGAGTYNINIYTNVGGNRYAAECTKGFYAEITDPNSCYLYPNQRAMYNENSALVAKAAELCAGKETDLEKIGAIYNYVRDNVKYDYIFALNVQTGYLPNPDATLASGKGICYDMASLLTAMLRSQGFYTKLVTGTLNNNQTHAWNKVLVDGKWKMLDPTNGSKYKSSAYEEGATF